MSQKNTKPGALREIAFLFLRLGTVAFGGPAAHIAMMEDEIVTRRRWVTREKFLDLLGATNLIPGPNSTELAIHLGHIRGGWPGLLVAGVCFISPAMLITMAFGWMYVTYGSLPHVSGLLFGIKPVIIAVVLQALWNLGKTALKTKDLIVVGVTSFALTAFGVNEILVLVLAGAGLLVARRLQTKSSVNLVALSGVSTLVASANLAWATTLGGAVPFSLQALFWFFLKVGSVLYGSGYVLLAFLQSGLVENRGWLTQPQLIDAVAVGQITPGPVFTTATFIGYVLNGPKAALIATLGIFLPAFVFVALSAPLIPRIRNSPAAGAVLDGVNAASLALMAYVTWLLGRSALIDLATMTIALISAILLIRFKVNSTWLIAGGAVIGVVLKLST